MSVQSLILLLGSLAFLVIPAVIAAAILRCIWLEYRHDRIPILLYHRLIRKADADAGIVPDTEMIWVSYDTVFAEQMQYLREGGYTAIGMDEYLQIRSGKLPAPAKPIIITFDDGYLSTYTLGYPVLKSLGLKATVFVSLEPDAHTRNQVAGVDGFLNAAQLREMSDAGMDIQSHTVTHCILSELDDATARRELTESRRRLSEITGRPVEHIAIPRSGYSRRIRRFVREAGYQTACCNNKGTASAWSDPLALPRIVVERDMGVSEFAWALSPRGSATLRIVGNIKRIPERIGGGRFARRVRDVLYRGPLKEVFKTRNLKRVVVLGGAVYVAAAIAFAGYLLIH